MSNENYTEISNLLDIIEKNGRAVFMLSKEIGL